MTHHSPSHQLRRELWELADQWDEQAKTDTYQHGDPWCVAKADCAEELRKVLE